RRQQCRTQYRQRYRAEDEILDGHEYSVRPLLEERGIAVGQRLHELLMKVRVTIRNGRSDTLLVQAARAIDLCTESHAQITLFSTDANRSFVVQLDLGHEQPGVATCALDVVVTGIAGWWIHNRCAGHAERPARDESHRLRSPNGGK